MTQTKHLLFALTRGLAMYRECHN